MAGSIYGELLKFAEKLEPWQQDALRRHAESPTLSAADVSELTDIAFVAALAKEKHLAGETLNSHFPTSSPWQKCMYPAPHR